MKPVHPVYSQDVVAPETLVHGFEFGDPDPKADGQFGYVYNFLDYTFAEGEAGVVVRHYLDEPGTVKLLGRVDINSDFMMRVMMFMAMRFDAVEYFSEAGYGPIPSMLREEVNRRVAAHMKLAGTT